jgi:hypothetical protein
LEQKDLTKNRIPSLKIETLNDRGNFLYLSLIEYKRETYLCVVDEVTEDTISAFVLDYAEQENIKISAFLSFVTRWFYSNSDNYSLSTELAKLGLSEHMSPIYKTFEITYVTRIVGNPFSFKKPKSTTKVKRRRVAAIPDYIEIVFKKTQRDDPAKA